MVILPIAKSGMSRDGELNMAEYKNIFAKNLAFLVKESGKTIKEISEDTGIPTGSLSKYQNGQAEAGIEKLSILANYFEVSTDWLLGRALSRSIDTSKQAACKYLCLSETAIDALRLKEDGGALDGARHFFFDLLLNEPSFPQFVDAAFQYSKFNTSLKSKVADSTIEIYASENSKGFDMPVTIENLSDALNLGLLKKLIPIINSAYDNWLKATTAYFSKEENDNG